MKTSGAFLSTALVTTLSGPTTARVTWEEDAISAKETKYVCDDEYGCSNRVKVMLPQVTKGLSFDAGFGTNDTLALESWDGKDVVTFVGGNCTRSTVHVEALAELSNGDTVLEMHPSNCALHITATSSPSVGSERHPKTGQPRSGDGGDGARAVDKGGLRLLQTTTVATPGTGTIRGFLKIVLGAGSVDGARVRVRVRGYGLGVYPTSSSLSRTISTGSSSGTSWVSHEVNTDTACTNQIRYNIIEPLSAPTNTQYIEVWQYGETSQGAWKSMSMDVLAECADVGGSPRYVENVHSVSSGAEPVEFDLFSGYNGVLRSLQPDGGNYEKLFDFNCEATSPQFSQTRCSYSTKPSYVSGTFDETVCGNGGTTYDLDTNGNVVTRRLQERELQFSGAGFLIGCATAVGKLAIAQSFGTVVGQGPLNGQGASQVVATASAGFAVLAYSTITTAASATPEGILGGLVCGAAANIISVYWGKKLAPGWGKAPNVEEALRSEGVCTL